MKLSRPLWALTLIALALLLSAASVTTESPSQPNQGTQTQSPAQQHSSTASPRMPALNQAAAKPTARKGRTNTDYECKQPGPWGDFPTWLEAIATLGLVGFAAWQMRLIKDAAVAAKNNAEAAKLQADAAIKTFQLAVRAKIEVHPTVVLESGNDQIVTAYFEVVNEGETAATIQYQVFNFFYKFRQWIYPPQFPMVPKDSPQPLPAQFQSHDRADTQIESVKLDGLIGGGPNREWDFYISDAMVICFCARILYFDQGGQFHETFLCEAWDRTSKRFYIDQEMPRSWNRST
jgi:hypothetical protein